MNENTTQEVLVYDLCSNETPERTEVEGSHLCQRCVDNNCENCGQCDRLCNTDNMRCTEHDGYVCEDCFNDDYFTCERCDQSLHNDNRASDCDDYVCQDCYDNDDDREVRERRPDFATTAHQSAPNGLLKSKRRFGIELESVYKSSSGAYELRDSLPEGFGLVHDGSIDTDDSSVGGIEIVSPVLKGEAGEVAVKRLCSLARANGFHVNESCGFHLHLEAPDFVRDVSKDKKEWDREGVNAKIQYVYTDRYGDNNVSEELPYEGSLSLDNVPDFKIKATRQVAERIINRGDSFYRLRNLLGFYACFDDVFRATQPMSRRHNSFCHPVKALYPLEEIERCEDYGALEALYYKEHNSMKVDKRKKGGKYDQSRYSALNLHILFSTGKTIELRYHSPTLNAEKVLRWVDIHQSIFDNVNRYDLSELRKIDAQYVDIYQKLEQLCRLAKISEETKAYMVRRIKAFNSGADDKELSDTNTN
jgi:hypothetical protein